MDAALFTKMLSDQKLTDLRKLSYKYPQADMAEFIQLLKNGFYKTLPLKDFSGTPIVYRACLSHKQVEKDFGDAAYATIRGFVLKFETLGLLHCVTYGNRKKYQIVG